MHERRTRANHVHILSKGRLTLLVWIYTVAYFYEHADVTFNWLYITYVSKIKTMYESKGRV